MNLVPKAVTRMGGRALLKLNAASPTLLVVSGVVGLGATAFLAAKATRKLDPILDQHKQTRGEIGYIGTSREQQREVTKLYLRTGGELAKLYGPTIFVGATSAVAVLGGHRILRGRQLATMAAYSGLMEQFGAYRKRIAETLGEDMEREIYEGARGEWKEDPNHKGEYKLTPSFSGNSPDSYLRPWFDETNVNWTRDPIANYMFLKGVQAHMQNLLSIRGHVFLNDVYDALGMPRCPEGAVSGWVRNSKSGDGFVDFGFMTSHDPHTVAFVNGVEKTVRLNFNIDGVVWDLI